MAAIHQRSSSNIETSTDPPASKNANFIESMEEEVKRCAEHLERRQSYRNFRSKERKANGFAPVGLPLSSAGFHSSAEIGSRNVSYRSTLPRSFRSSAADQEDRTILSPRIIPPGRKSPHKSPDKNSGNRVFRFSNGFEDIYSGHYHPHHDDLVSPYPRGNSAPPDAYPCYGAGSSASSRDNSLSSLHSPLGRTPIGAVASHSRSRRSSCSSSSPPPVPPKPGQNRSRRAKSHTPPPPPPIRSITVSSYCNKDPLKSAVDPLPPTELAEASCDTPSKELEFPSAEIDLPSFPDKMLKVKSISVSALSTRPAETPVERNRVRESSAPPLMSSPTSGGVPSGGAGQIPAVQLATASICSSTSDGQDASSNLSSPEVKRISCRSDVGRGNRRALKKSLLVSSGTDSEQVKSTVAPIDSPTGKQEELNADQDAMDCERDAQDEEQVQELDVDTVFKTVDSQVEESQEESNGDGPLSNSNEDEISEESSTPKEENEEREMGESCVAEGCKNTSPGGDESEKEKSESSDTKKIKTIEELKKEGDELMAKSEETTEFLSPAASSESGIADKDGSDISPDESPVQTRIPVMATVNANPSPSRSPSSSPSPSPQHIKQESPKIVQSSMPSNRRGSFEIEEVFLPVTLNHQKDVMATDAAEPEVKSIPIHFRGVRHGSKHARGRGGAPKIVPPSVSALEDRGSSEPPTTTPPLMDDESRPRIQSEPPRSGNKPQSFSIDPTILGDANDSVRTLVEELVKQINDKDSELVRLHHQREKDIKERDERIKKLSREAKKVERDKWELLKRARDGAERSLHLRTQLDMKEGALRSLQGELDRTKDELVSVKSANTSLRALLSDLRAGRASTEVGVQVELIGGGTLRRNRSIELAYSGLSQEQDPMFDRSMDHRMSSSSLNWPDRWADRDSYMDSSSLTDELREVTPTPSQLLNTSLPLGTRESRKSRKKSAFLAKMIRSSGRRGSKASVGSMDGLDIGPSSLLSSSNQSSYQPLPLDLKEQWRILEEAKSVPFSKWDLQATMAWFEVGLGMGQFSRAVVEKYPSGASLCSLTEADMEKKLGMSNPLHRRKLSLALQEKKSPQSCQYPHAGNIDHNWVAYEWAHDCGLAHLTEALTTHLIDGRVLNSLSKDDLKRYLKITKKVDQLSFLSGVELLRMHEFNRETIQQHRRNSHNPLYWTNGDICEWLQRINLQDYAGNVIGGGIHGALLFLERGRFNAEHLANIIQIPSNKGQLRRHLTGKLASLFSDDISGSMDSLHRRSIGNNSPLNLSPGNPYGASSQSPVSIRRSHSPLKGTTSSPMRDCHPVRRNSLTRRSIQLLTHHSLAPPAGLQRTGSNPTTSQGDLNSPSPQHLNRSALDPGERARMSLRESALRSARDEAPPCNRTATPTVLSSTTV